MWMYIELFGPKLSALQLTEGEASWRERGAIIEVMDGEWWLGGVVGAGRGKTRALRDSGTTTLCQMLVGILTIKQIVIIIV